MAKGSGDQQGDMLLLSRVIVKNLEPISENRGGHIPIGCGVIVDVVRGSRGEISCLFLLMSQEKKKRMNKE